MGLLDRLENKLAVLFMKKKIKDLGSTIKMAGDLLTPKQQNVVVNIVSKIIGKYVDEETGKSVKDSFAPSSDEIMEIKRQLAEVINENKALRERYSINEKTGEVIEHGKPDK